MLDPTEQLRVRDPVSNAAGVLPEHLYWFGMSGDNALVGAPFLVLKYFWLNLLNKYSLRNRLLCFLENISYPSRSNQCCGKGTVLHKCDLNFSALRLRLVSTHEPEGKIKL